MAKEICTVEDFEVFKQVDRSKNFSRAKGWQFAPLHWVFAIKHNLRHRGRLVIGGHVANADALDKYAATTSLDGVKLQMYITVRSQKKLVSGDVVSAYLHTLKKRFGQHSGPSLVRK